MCIRDSCRSGPGQPRPALGRRGFGPRAASSLPPIDHRRGPPVGLSLIHISIAAAPPVLAVFGRTRLTGRLWDACDNPARDGERLSFAAPRGRFVGGSGEDRATTGGSAEIDLDVGGESGALPVTVRYGDLAASADIVVLAPTPMPTSVPRRNLYLPRLATHQR